MTAPGRRAYSNWFITISTNQRYSDYDSAKPLLRALQRAIKDVFDHLSDYVEFRTAGHSWTPEYITSVRVKQGVEFSPVRGQPHVHFLIAIQHRSRIHLDYAKIQKSVRESLAADCPDCFSVTREVDGHTVREPKNLYFFSRLYRDAAANYDAYVDKDRGQRETLGASSV